MSGNGKLAGRSPNARPWAAFGRETRYVGGLYLQRALIFILVAMAIILCLDVATNLSGVVERGVTVTAPENLARLAYYAMLRAGYNLPALLPLSALAGPLWAEHTLARSGERVMIFNSGRGPLKSLIPALLFGLFMGGAQFVAVAYARPATVAEQGSKGLRYYGAKFAADRMTGPIWFAIPGAIGNARFDLAQSVVLRDLQLFVMDDAGSIIRVITAASAQPGRSVRSWTLHSGAVWTVGTSTTSTGALHAMTFATREQALNLDRRWVANFDIAPELLDQPTLLALASGQAGIPRPFSYQAARDDRYAGIIYSLGMALLGASLALLRFTPETGLAGPLRIAGLGGVAYVGVHAAMMLGTFGNLPPAIAAWTVPSLIVIMSVAMVGFDEQRARSAQRRPSA